MLLRKNVLLLFACLALNHSVSWAEKPTAGVPEQTNYAARVSFIHSLIRDRAPQNTIDSVSRVIHRMLDSIRTEITLQNNNDSVKLLKTVLNNSINDSLNLVKINNLLNSATGNETGSVKAYCINTATQYPLDSIKVSIYNNKDSLVVSSYSARDGFCNIVNLKQGEYTLTFSKNNYNLSSDRWIKVTSGKVTRIEAALPNSLGFSFPGYPAYIWIIIVCGTILLFFLIYAILRKFVNFSA